MDFVQEYRAGQAADRLRQSVAVRAKALRDGKFNDILIADLVPGDVVMLSAGDLIPCDGRVFEAGIALAERLLRSLWEEPLSGHPAQDTSP